MNADSGESTGYHQLESEGDEDDYEEEEIVNEESNYTPEVFPSLVPIQPTQNQYTDQLAQLHSMGFIDDIRSIQILNLTGGDVSQAMEYLL